MRSKWSLELGGPKGCSGSNPSGVANATPSSFGGGVGGGSKGIILGVECAPTADPVADPAKLPKLCRDAARRSPDMLRSIRFSVGVTLRLLAREYERS